jgi:hypothetical protein
MTDEGNTTIEEVNGGENGNSNDNGNDVSNQKTKTIRTKFEKACTHCNKVLKSAKTYEHHINNQLCYSKNEITYCKICNIKKDTHTEYIKHLLSMEHLNSIGCNKLETLNTNQPSTILQADPYLSNNEARSIGTNNLGNKFKSLGVLAQGLGAGLKKSLTDPLTIITLIVEKALEFNKISVEPNSYSSAICIAI